MKSMHVFSHTPYCLSFLFSGPKYKPYFIPEVFAKLQQGDIHGRVSIMSLFNYVMRKVWLHQTRIGISQHYL